jgi:hypothetical protein
MKMAQGYVTEDGTFFESKFEAELHEAEFRLRAQMAVEYPQIGIEGFIEIVQNLMSTLKGYIDAYNTANTAIINQQAEVKDRTEAQVSGATKADGGIGHVSSTEKDLEALLKLPARGHSHVPDVGSSPRPKEIQKRRTKHGVGGGQPDA